MNTLITDGDNRAVLAIVHSLGRGQEVIVGATRRRSLAALSFRSTDNFACPNPFRDPGFPATERTGVPQFEVLRMGDIRP